MNQQAVEEEMISGLKSLIVFPKSSRPFPIPQHELLRIVASKAKWVEKTKSFIQVQTIQYIAECNVYVALYRVLDGVLPDSSLVEGPETEE